MVVVEKEGARASRRPKKATLLLLILTRANNCVRLRSSTLTVFWLRPLRSAPPRLDARHVSRSYEKNHRLESLVLCFAIKGPLRAGTPRLNVQPLLGNASNPTGPKNSHGCRDGGSRHEHSIDSHRIRHLCLFLPSRASKTCGDRCVPLRICAQPDLRHVAVQACSYFHS